MTAAGTSSGQKDKISKRHADDHHGPHAEPLNEPNRHRRHENRHGSKGKHQPTAHADVVRLLQQPPSVESAK